MKDMFDYGTLGLMRSLPASAAAAVIFIANLGLGPFPAHAAGGDDIAAGRALVETHCSRCHATGNAGESPLAAAPKFRDLHFLYDVAFLSEALVEGIATAHPDMPQFQFDPFQAEAIIAYLKSLER
jgi:cytochrome c